MLKHLNIISIISNVLPNLIFSLALPLEMYSIYHQYPWQLGELMCHVKTLVLESTANASVLTLGKGCDLIQLLTLASFVSIFARIHPVTFTVERFLAICGTSKPPNQNMFTPKSITHMKKIALRNISLIWVVSLCGASPMVAYTRINYLEYNETRLEESAWCGLPYNEPDRRWEWVMLSSTILFFLIPLTIITVLYYRIAQKLRRATRLDPVSQQDMQLTDHATSRKIVQSRRIVIRMLGKTHFTIRSKRACVCALSTRTKICHSRKCSNYKLINKINMV